MGTCYSKNYINLERESNSTFPIPNLNKEINNEFSNSKIGLKDFHIIRILGEGAFATVFLVQHIKTGKNYAMKCLKKKELYYKNQILNTKTERFVLELTTSVFIVTLHCAFQTNNYLFMLMDFIDGGELFFYLRINTCFEENIVKFIVAQIVLAIEHLHNLNIIYRDLKPENIMIGNDGYIKLTDFGLSKYEELGKTFCGTPEYFAPEIILNQKYNKSVDWWSLGIILYELYCGYTPFYNKNSIKMYKNILENKPKTNLKIKPIAMSLIEKLLQKDPKKRFGFDGNDSEIIKKHPYFENINWNLLKEKKLTSPIKISEKDIKSFKFFDKKFNYQNIKKHDIFQENIFNKKSKSIIKFSLEFEDFTFKRGSFDKDLLTSI